MKPRIGDKYRLGKSIYEVVGLTKFGPRLSARHITGGDAVDKVWGWSEFELWFGVRHPVNKERKERRRM